MISYYETTFLSFLLFTNFFFQITTKRRLTHQIIFTYCCILHNIFARDRTVQRQRRRRNRRDTCKTHADLQPEHPVRFSDVVAGRRSSVAARRRSSLAARRSSPVARRSSPVARRSSFVARRSSPAAATCHTNSEARGAGRSGRAVGASVRGGPEVGAHRVGHGRRAARYAAEPVRVVRVRGDSGDAAVAGRLALLGEARREPATVADLRGRVAAAPAPPYLLRRAAGGRLRQTRPVRHGPRVALTRAPVGSASGVFCFCSSRFGLFRTV